MVDPIAPTSPTPKAKTDQLVGTVAPAPQPPAPAAAPAAAPTPMASDSGPKLADRKSNLVFGAPGAPRTGGPKAPAATPAQGAGAPPAPDAGAPKELNDEAKQHWNTLAASGALDKPGRDGKTLRDNVDTYLATGGDANVANSVLKQIANPNQEIWQGQGDTCAAATAQKALAKTDPASYFKLASDFAYSNEAKLPNGETATLSDQNRAAIDEKYDKGEINDQQKHDMQLQAALTDYANGDASYDLATDTSTRPDGSKTTGLTADQTARLNDAMVWGATHNPQATEANVDQRMAQDPSLSRQDAVTASMRDQLADAQAKGKPFFAHLDKGDGTPREDGTRAADRHVVQVLGMDDQGNVKIRDGNGKPQTMSAAEFARQASLGGSDDDHDGRGHH